MTTLRMSIKEFDKMLLESKLEAIREVQTYNERYLEIEPLNLYLEALKSKYIFEERKKNG